MYKGITNSKLIFLDWCCAMWTGDLIHCIYLEFFFFLSLFFRGFRVRQERSGNKTLHPTQGWFRTFPCPITYLVSPDRCTCSARTVPIACPRLTLEIDASNQNGPGAGSKVEKERERESERKKERIDE